MIGAILFTLFMAGLIALGLRARNRAYAAIQQSMLDEKLGDEMSPGMEEDGGMDMVQIIGYNAMDLSGIVLGGTGLDQRQVWKLWNGYHLLCDFKCQLCLKVMPESPEPCNPRVNDPPPVELDEDDIEFMEDAANDVCDYCMGEGCDECGPIGR